MTTVSATMKTIVIASGAAAVRDRFAAAIENAGHRAVTARSTAELHACIDAAAGGVDLVVLDLRLPDAGTADPVQAVRGRAGGAALPILVFSGSVRSAREARALETLGVAGYINEHSAVQYILPSLAPHLFPDSFNRRSGARVMLSVPVEYRAAETIAGALTLNLGSGGVAIRTTMPLPCGVRVDVRFRLPGSRRDADAGGRVTWSDPRVGMGVQFDQVEPSSQAIIDNFVDAHRLSQRL
jgi:uncharacterized protein (TIGR02266 family)